MTSILRTAAALTILALAILALAWGTASTPAMAQTHGKPAGSVTANFAPSAQLHAVTMAAPRPAAHVRRTTLHRKPVAHAAATAPAAASAAGH